MMKFNVSLLLVNRSFSTSVLQFNKKQTDDDHIANRRLWLIVFVMQREELLNLLITRSFLNHIRANISFLGIILDVKHYQTLLCGFIRYYDEFVSICVEHVTLVHYKITNVKIEPHEILSIPFFDTMNFIKNADLLKEVCYILFLINIGYNHFENHRLGNFDLNPLTLDMSKFEFNYFTGLDAGFFREFFKFFFKDNPSPFYQNMDWASTVITIKEHEN